jgi:hypothetical protein
VKGLNGCEEQTPNLASSAKGTKGAKEAEEKSHAKTPSRKGKKVRGETRLVEFLCGLSDLAVKYICLSV